MTSTIRTQISHLVAAIRALDTRLKPLSDHYAQKVRSYPPDKSLAYSREYWQTLSMHDSLTRMRNFIENNFSVIETLAVLSLARYTFELVVQLKRIDLDPTFAVVYARELLEQQVEHHKKMAEHLESEIALYRQLAARESVERRKALVAAVAQAKLEPGVDSGQRIAESMQTASAKIDEELAVSLTLYSEDAKINGFSFQAHLLETKALPQLLAAVAQNEESLIEFNAAWGTILADRKYIINKWNKRAEQVEMEAEYNFIYNYTSRLLHATPVSISTNQQCLDDGEVLLFFKYIHAEFLWITRRAEQVKLLSTVH